MFSLQYLIRYAETALKISGKHFLRRRYGIVEMDIWMKNAVVSCIGLKQECSFDRNGGVDYQRETTETKLTIETTEIALR
jgi:hypothetical protein